ncbi:MAG: putative drug exporter of the superfamily [Solirubrobacteraceae bacterium]|jgi:RND superfamily putative drug exporter|nr:putative drug exporter of the superfamily [Solirubrobacteraceae bacterium]
MTERQRSRFGPEGLAEFATRRPRRVLAVWAGIVIVSLGLIGTLLGTSLTSDSSLTNNPDSTKAQNLIDTRLPQQNNVDELIVVRSERAVVSDPAFASRVRALTKEIRQSDAVQGISSYLDPGNEILVSADKHATALPVVLAHPQEDRIVDVIAIVKQANGKAGFATHITGGYTLDRDFTELSASDLSKGELQFGLPAALIVLLLVVGTLFGVMIPMLMAILSIVVALAVTAVVGQAFPLNLFVLNMVVAMGLALGIDYSLFIVSRLREERHRGKKTREAILAVASTATRAVLFSGTAFVLAMIAMLLVPDTTLRSLGLGAVIVGLVSVLVALTFHPALLMVLGDRVDRWRLPWLGQRIADSSGEEGPLWRRAVLAVMRRPAISLVATTAVLLALAFPVLDLRMGDGGTSALPNSTVAKQGLLALERDFPTGAIDPVAIVIDGSAKDSGTQAGLTRLRAELSADRDFAAAALTVDNGSDIAVAFLPLSVEPTSERASAAIDRLREEYVPAAFGATADRVFVGGAPAEARDSFAVNTSWLPIVIVFVLALSFVLLLVAFRSITIPLTAIAVNLLSVGAAYGILVLVFQKGVGSDLLGFTQVERIDAWVPIFLFCVLFGLSMDYQVFLLSRIHERWSKTRDTPGAIVYGVASTARLITGAAAIIVVVFTGFATGQLVAFQEMGFGIAIALALDATLVRLLLIPAAMRLLGERNWYLPRWLAWLPDLQVEGPPAKARIKPRKDDSPKLPPVPPGALPAGS